MSRPKPSRAQPSPQAPGATAGCSRTWVWGAAIAVLLASGSLVWPACKPYKRLTYSAQDLRAELRRRAPALASGRLTVPFEVSAAHVARAQQATRVHQARSEKAKALMESLFDPACFNLRYADVATRSAEETLARGSGNCMSLASVYVGLARGIGLKAYYLDATNRFEDLHQEQDMLVRTGHVTAVVETERGKVAMDFGQSLSPFRIFRVMDDVEAVAHFHNNQGYERIYEARAAGQPVPWTEVADHFRHATEVMPEFVRAWNNLGVALARAGRSTEAMAAYRRAVRLDPQFSAAHGNLGALLLEQGQVAAAMNAFRLALQADPDSPLAHFHLALALLRAGRTGEACIHLTQARLGRASLDQARALRAEHCGPFGGEVETESARPRSVQGD